MTQKLPQAVRNAMEIEKVFGVPPISQFNRHFSAMIQKARMDPRSAVVHSIKAQDAVNIDLMTRGESPRSINGMFRAARTKIIQGMYSGLIYTCGRIAKELEGEGFGVAPSIKEYEYVG